jgi:tRNA-modifying protein YgfZ
MDHNAIGAHSGRLPHLGLLRFTGADAAAFLQGQVSNDTARLAGGHALLCALSSVQGRVIAVLTLLPHSTGIVAILPAALVAPVAARLQKFILRSKVRIEAPAAGLCVGGHHGAAALLRAGLPVPADIGAYREAQGIGVARVADAQPRYWVIGAGTDAGGAAAGGAGGGAAAGGADADTAARVEAAWRLADIRAGLPQVYPETSEEFVAQMLNLDLVDGISFAKGCYTGQEIIARTQHLGRIKRRMFRIAIDVAAGDAAPGAAPPIGATVHLGDGRSGRVIEIAPLATAATAAIVDRGGASLEALAVLPLAAPGQDAASASPVTLLRLPYSVE